MKIVIPMAGLGSRFKTVGIDTPKPLIMVDGKSLIEHSVESLGIDGDYIFITRKYENEEHNINLSKLLQKIKPGSIEIVLDFNQNGAADAAMYARQYIDNEEELIITNCDQLLHWDASDFLEKVRSASADGAVLLYESDDIKNSYAKIDNNLVVEIAEKKIISNDALVGVHYWKHGKLFVNSAQKYLLDENIKSKERYISETYQYLIADGLNIYPYKVDESAYVCLGTPEHVNIYLGKIREFYTEKPKTIFCDIDGTIIKHAHSFSEVSSNDAIPLDGVIKKFNEWDSKGYKIILTTARKESARTITEMQLSKLGLCWDYLLMGITSGERVLINDKLKLKDSDRARAINLVTDSGFSGSEVESI